MHTNDKICFAFTHKYVNTNKIKICMIKNIKYLLYYFFCKYIFYFSNANTEIYLFFSKLFSLLCVPFIFYLKELQTIDAIQKNKYMPCKAYWKNLLARLAHTAKVVVDIFL